MINKFEIMGHARRFGLSPNIIEKDYLISWVLAGIFSQNNLRESWIFKGGTCLKKCFFQNYRFSEDMDFTLLDHHHIDTQFLKFKFIEIAQWVYSNSGLEIPESSIEFEQYENRQGKIAVEGKLSYRGPMQRRGDLSRVKFDLTHNEKIVLEPEKREIFHPYSDNLGDNGKIFSYCLEEIFAEKLRALVERLRPRDLYDVIHLYDEKSQEMKKKDFISSLNGKFKYKNIHFPTIASLLARSDKEELVSEWYNMLAHQIKNLLPFENYWQRLPEVFSWIEQEDLSLA